MAGKRTDKLNEYGVEPRDLTIAQRRELFLKTSQEYGKKDWRVLQANTEETLVPFNLLSLDQGLKLYGIAGMGTVYQFHGDEGSGKTTIVAEIAKQYMKATDEPMVYFDFERRLKSRYLRAMNFDESMAHIDRPDSWEVAVQKAIDFMNKGVRLFVFDSIPRMRSKVDLKDIKSGAAFKVQPGTHARAIQQFYDLILPYIAGVDGTLIMVNQTRSRIEMSQEAQSAAKGYSTVTNLNYTLPGGRANRYAVSVMVENKLLRAWKPGKHEDPFVLEPTAMRGEEYLAMEIRHRTLKNTVSGTGYRQSTSWIRPGLGIDENITIREIGRQFKFIANHGAKYFVGETYDNPIKVYPNKDAAIKDLVIEENPEVLAALKELISEKFASNDAAFQIEVGDDAARYLAGEGDDETEHTNPEGFDVEDLSEIGK